jgi:hypothetical protein
MVKISAISDIYVPWQFILSIAYLTFYEQVHIVPYGFCHIDIEFEFCFCRPKRDLQPLRYWNTLHVKKSILEGIKIGLVGPVIFWNKIVSCVVLKLIFMYGMLIPIIKIELFFYVMNSYFVICVWWYDPYEFCTLGEKKSNTIGSSDQITSKTQIYFGINYPLRVRSLATDTFVVRHLLLVCNALHIGYQRMYMRCIIS